MAAPTCDGACTGTDANADDCAMHAASKERLETLVALSYRTPAETAVLE